MGVDQPQASKPASPGTETAHVGQHELRRVAQNHVMHRPATVDEHADLSPRRVRHAHEGARELRSRQPVQRHLAPINALQRLGFGRAETARVAVDLHRYLSSPHRYVRLDDAKAPGDVMSTDAARKPTVGLHEISSHQTEVRVLFARA